MCVPSPSHRPTRGSPRVPFTRSRREEPSPYAMDGFSNVTPVTVDDDPLGNQLADAMDGLRCSRSTRAVQPPVVPQQTARQKKVLEELADSMVSRTSSLGPKHAAVGVWPFPVWLGPRLRLATAARAPRVTSSPHRPSPRPVDRLSCYPSTSLSSA